jgi:hypothetical protein
MSGLGSARTTVRFAANRSSHRSGPHQLTSYTNPVDRYKAIICWSESENTKVNELGEVRE